MYKLIAFCIFVFLVFFPMNKWYSIFATVVGITISVIWMQYFYTVAQAEQREGPGEGLGLAIMAGITVTFILCLLGRILFLLYKKPKNLNVEEKS